MAPQNNVPQSERWLALALLLALLALAYLVLLHGWWTRPMLAQQARIDTLQAQQQRIRTRMQQAPQIQKLLAEARRLRGDSPGFLSEASAELATAGLLQRLDKVVAEASPGSVACAISNRAPLVDNRRDEPYTRVTVQVRLQCGSRELAAVLHALESGAPRLFIGNLTITSLAHRYLGDGSDEGGLDVGFDLYGYLRPPAAPARPAADPKSREVADAP